VIARNLKQGAPRRQEQNRIWLHRESSL